MRSIFTLLLIIALSIGINAPFTFAEPVKTIHENESLKIMELTPDSPVEIFKEGIDKNEILIRAGLKLEVAADRNGKSNVYLSGSILHGDKKIETGKKVVLGMYEGPWKVVSSGNNFDVYDSSGKLLDPSVYKMNGNSCETRIGEDKSQISQIDWDHIFETPEIGGCGMGCDGYSVEAGDGTYCVRCYFWCRDNNGGFWIWFAITICSDGGGIIEV